MDSDTRVYRMEPVELADTLYDGVRMVLKSVETDSLSVDTVDALEPVAEPVEVQEPKPVPMQELEPEKTFKPKTIRRMDSQAGERIEPIEINRQ